MQAPRRQTYHRGDAHGIEPASTVRGCTDGDWLPIATQWQVVRWDVELPAGTTISVRARSNSQRDLNDPGWHTNPWVAPATAPPLVLDGVLRPNLPSADGIGTPDGYLEIEVQLSSQRPPASPVIKEISGCFKCWHWHLG